MEIILKEDVERLGKAGDVVKVAPGYARNHLIPRGLALLATPGARAQIALERKRREKDVQKQKEEAAKLAQRLASISCTITVKVGPDDELFGEVNKADIAEALETEGITLDKKKILLDEPIKSLGIYQVQVRVHPEITTAVKVWVVKE